MTSLFEMFETQRSTHKKLFKSQIFKVLFDTFGVCGKSVNVIGGRQVTTCARAHMETIEKIIKHNSDIV